MLLLVLSPPRGTVLVLSETVLVLDGCLNCGDADARQDLLMNDYQDGSVISFCSKPLVRRRQESQCLHGWP